MKGNSHKLMSLGGHCCLNNWATVKRILLGEIFCPTFENENIRLIGIESIGNARRTC